VTQESSVAMVDYGFTVTASANVSATGISLENTEFDSGTSSWSVVDYTTPSTAAITVVTGAGLSCTNALRVDVNEYRITPTLV